MVADLKGISIQQADHGWDPNFHRVSGKTVVDTKVETCFALRDETDPVVSFPGVGDEVGLDSRLSHSHLLSASPTVWVAEDKNNVRFDRGPDRSPKCMGILDIGFRTSEQIVHEVGKDVDDGKAVG